MDYKLKATAPSERIMLLAVLIFSLPIWWIVGIFALVSFGFGIWLIPFLLSWLGIFIPNGIFVGTEFDGPILVFTVAASIQNALLVKGYLHYKETSKLVRIVFWCATTLFICVFVLSTGFIVLVYGPEELFYVFSFRRD